MEIAIFGAGIAGLATAVALGVRGHGCRIYERSRESQDAGMGFILVPDVCERLQRLGVPTVGVPLRTYHCRNQAGEVLYSEAILPGTRSVLRRDFIAALAAALPPGDLLSFDDELTAFQFDTRGRTTEARLASGRRIHADLYIAADGTGSRARQALFPGWPMPPARVQELVGLVRSAEAIRWGEQNFNKFFATEGGLAFGVLQVDAEHVVWYVQFDSQALAAPAGAHARRGFVTSLVGDWAEPIPALLAVSDFNRVHLWRPIDSDLVPSFHRENLVLVGDAAHPLSPFTSQGVSSAVADAMSLANAVASASSGAMTLEQGLAAYSRDRRQGCVPYIEKGRYFRQKFLSPLSTHTDLVPIAYRE